jgi:hypothetical protein
MVNVTYRKSNSLRDQVFLCGENIVFDAAGDVVRHIVSLLAAFNRSGYQDPTRRGYGADYVYCDWRD